MTKRFNLESAQSPTHFNLCEGLSALDWRFSRFPWLSSFSDKNLQFNQEVSQCLEYKHLLAQLVHHYCPEVMPETYPIDDANWPKVLSNLMQSYPKPSVWILKPSLLNNGQHIKIFQNYEEIESHFLSARRMGGSHVLQRYIQNPELLRDSRKYSIRLFVVLTDYDGAFLYPYGYYNVSNNRYTPDQFEDSRPHLTNEHLNNEEVNVIQIPSARFADFSSTYQPIKELLTKVMQGLHSEFTKELQSRKNRHIALFGFDFMKDTTGRVWLLEANHGPCFPKTYEHPLQHYLYESFWKELIDCFIIPIAKNKDLSTLSYSPFERII